MQPMLMECAVRAMLIAIGTAAVLAMLGVKTAAARHAAWSGVVLAMLVLPLWTAWGPKAALRVLPQGAARAAAVLHAPAPLSARPVVADRAPNNPAPSRHGWNWGTIALGAYLLGVCALLLRLGIGTARARRLLRHAASDDGVMVSPCCSAPVTVGWLHPSVILPPGWREWPEGKLNAVLAHEREHARRRDPLVQWLALLNRALFWFHPLAWWLERRVCALAEEACDGAAIAHGHDPRDYSEYLLEFARSVEHSGSRIQEWGMAMPGGFLGQRIHQILAAAPAPRTSRARLACAAAACTLAAVVFTAGRLDSIHAQTAVFVPAGPVFEDVSIQVMPVYRGNEAAAALKYRPPAPGTIQHWHQNLKALVMEAFAVEEYRVEGRTGRDAEMSPSYTITAKAPPKDMPEAQVREMLQRLLVERFHLALTGSGRWFRCTTWWRDRMPCRVSCPRRKARTACMRQAADGFTPGRSRSLAWLSRFRIQCRATPSTRPASRVRTRSISIGRLTPRSGAAIHCRGARCSTPPRTTRWRPAWWPRWMAWASSSNRTRK